MANSTRMRFGPDGVHLFNRLTGTNILFDEVVISPEFWSKAPRNVSIAITNACDLNCTYCYAPKNDASLDYETLIFWLDELNSNGCHGVCLGGGEPTLHKDFVKICRYLNDKTELAVSFTTNAIAFPERFTKDITGCVHFVRISLNEWFFSTDDIQSRMTVFLRNIENLKRVSPIGVNFIVTNENIQHIEQVYNLATKYNAKEILLLPEVSRENTQTLTANNQKILLEWVKHHQCGLHLSISENGCDEFPYCIPLKNEQSLSSYVHIDANGIMKASSFDNEGITISNSGLMEAFRLLNERESRDENLARIRIRALSQTGNDREV